MTRKSRSSLSSPLTLETLIAQGAIRAFESIRDELAAVPLEALKPINLEVTRAARRGLVVFERLQPLLADLSMMIHLDFPKVEKLPTYALALLYAHELAETPAERVTPLVDLVAQATSLRSDLMQTAEMLAHFGLVSSERVASIRRGQGYADLAGNLLALSVMLGGMWKTIENKVVITYDQIERASPLSAQLQRAIGARESNVDPLQERTDPRHVRAKAFTLFMRAYDECRRGVSHLRWHHGDAADIVPSLYPRRGGRPKDDMPKDDMPKDDGSADAPVEGRTSEPEPAPGTAA